MATTYIGIGVDGYLWYSISWSWDVIQVASMLVTCHAPLCNKLVPVKCSCWCASLTIVCIRLGWGGINLLSKIFAHKVMDPESTLMYCSGMNK